MRDPNPLPIRGFPRAHTIRSTRIKAKDAILVNPNIIIKISNNQGESKPKGTSSKDTEGESLPLPYLDFMAWC